MRSCVCVCVCVIQTLWFLHVFVYARSQEIDGNTLSYTKCSTMLSDFDETQGNNNKNGKIRRER